MIVFTGAGERAFCVGGDVREPTRTAAEKRSLHHLHDRLGLAIRNNGKPIIVKVRGYCIGGGNELNVLCDLTISGASGKFGQAGPKIGSAPLWWGCQLLPAGGGREEGARDPLPDPPVHAPRRPWRWAWSTRSCPTRSSTPRSTAGATEILRRSPQGLRLAKIAMNAATDQLYSARPARPRARRAEPRLRPGAQGGDRHLPGEAARRLAQVPRRARARSPADDARRPARRALREGGRGRPRGAAPQRRPGPRAGRRARRRAPRPLGGGGRAARPGPPAPGHLLAQGLHPADQPVPRRLLATAPSPTTTRTRGPTR